MVLASWEVVVGQTKPAAREGQACKPTLSAERKSTWQLAMQCLQHHTSYQNTCNNAGQIHTWMRKREFRVMTVASVGLLHTSTGGNEIRFWLWVSVSKQCEG